jgi:hypothetical protein
LIRQKSFSNITGVWTDGLINSLNLKAVTADLGGMQACFSGHQDPKSFKFENGVMPPVDTTTNGLDGMYLWYASEENKLEQYGIIQGSSDWTEQSTFNGMNVQAGVGCYFWGTTTVQYAAMVNMQNTMELWWKDTNSSTSSTAIHPINSWVNSRCFKLHTLTI